MQVIRTFSMEGGAAFYRWRRKSRVRGSRQNSQAAKYGRKFRGYWRRIRRMPYGGGTMSVGVREEMESHSGLIHYRSGEIAHLVHRRGGEVRRSDHSGSLGKLDMNQERCWRHDPLGRGAHLSPTIRWRSFAHQT
ncbi:hypothetical protein Acr_15g0010130 [Actinidia rufa]|uniref:Uncharacterized protein n=1 Tax=Actinidia rufa TaxID=165716 RepID=A0A7J0FUM2_9ERIC|nr:hypothetical protein Acr_15g0010130 [Actinidia rufa]